MTSTLEGDRARIEAAIPHREPFLLLDRIVSEGEQSLTTAWHVPVDADWFRGHYPGQPILPGVLLTEHVLQSAAVFVSEQLGGFGAEDGVPVLAKLENARFRRPIRPGETVETEVRLEERVGPAWFFRGRVRCAGERALDVRFVLSATGAMARTFGVD